MYENNGYKHYDEVIVGYVFGVMETPDKHYLFSAPMGDTQGDKSMFDTLVYNRIGLYAGTDKDKIKRDIENFIKLYKREVKENVSKKCKVNEL